MRISIYILLLLFFCGRLWAQNCTSDRYEAEIFSQLDIQRNVVYGTAPQLTPVYLGENVTFQRNLDMDIFQPAGDTLALRPLMLWAFGGAFIIGSKEAGDMQTMCERFARRGFVTASINYRLGMNLTNPNSAERAVFRCTQDLSAAVRYFKEFAQQYRIDTNQIFVGGNSAGSIGAVHLAYVDDVDRPASTYGQGGLVPWPDLGCKDCTGNNYPHSSNVRAVINCWGAIGDTSWIKPNNLKPIISIHGDADNIVPYGVGAPFSADLVMPTTYGSSVIHPRIQNLGGYSEFIPLPGAGHVPWGIPGVPTALFDPLYDSIANFTVRVLEPPPGNLLGGTSACVGEVGTYYLDNSNTYNSQCWSVTGGSIIYQSVQSDTIKVAWQQNGTVTLEGNSSNDLALESLELNVTVYPLPSPRIVGDSTACKGDSITLQGQGGVSYLWQLADTTYSNARITILPDSSGTVQLTVGSNAGCFDSITSAYTIYPLPDTPIIQSYNNILGTSAVGQFEWFFEGGAVLNSDQPTIVPPFEGNYQVEVTNADGCSQISAPYFYSITDTAQDTVSVSITELALQAIGVYPNPFTEQLTLSNLPANIRLALYNIQGQVQQLHYTISQGAVVLNTETLPSGVYVLHVHKDAAVHQIKLLKL